MRYIAALDYDHLNNSLFLATLAQSISQQKQVKPIIVHAGSAYTEHIIQTGVMRKDAQKRSYKDLNHRLVTLLADEGVSAIGINGYQHKFIIQSGNTLQLDKNFFDQLPPRSALVVSCLVWDAETSKPAPTSLARVGRFLQNELDTEPIFAFSASNMNKIIVENPATARNWKKASDEFKKKYLPKEFQTYNHPLNLISAHNFRFLPETNKSIYIQ